jgi:hypothetical protein
VCAFDAPVPVRPKYMECFQTCAHLWDPPPAALTAASAAATAAESASATAASTGAGIGGPLEEAAVGLRGAAELCRVSRVYGAALQQCGAAAAAAQEQVRRHLQIEKEESREGRAKYWHRPGRLLFHGVFRFVGGSLGRCAAARGRGCLGQQGAGWRAARRAAAAAAAAAAAPPVASPPPPPWRRRHVCSPRRLCALPTAFSQRARPRPCSRRHQRCGSLCHRLSRRHNECRGHCRSNRSSRSHSSSRSSSRGGRHPALRPRFQRLLLRPRPRPRLEPLPPRARATAQELS